MTSLTVGACQLTCTTSDPDANLARMAELLLDTKRKYPDLGLFAFPELATTGYECGDDFDSLAVQWPSGGYLPRLAGLAREAGVVLVVGFAESLGSGSGLADSAAIFGSDGRALGCYRKTHCLDRELRHFLNGDELPLFRTAVGTIGVMICWDAAFPEVARTYAVRGAEYLVAIGAWEDPYVSDWGLVLSARAYDNVIPVLGVNRTGSEGAARFSGGSCIVDCLGAVVSGLNDEADGVVVGLVSVDLTTMTREGYGSQLRDRRPELYDACCTPIDPATGLIRATDL